MCACMLIGWTGMVVAGIDGAEAAMGGGMDGGGGGIDGADPGNSGGGGGGADMLTRPGPAPKRLRLTTAKF